MASGISMPSGMRLCPILGTWQETIQPNKVAFQPELGPPKLRRRGTARTYPTSFSVSLSRLERGSFWNWYRDDLIDGVLPFIMAHPYEQVAFDWQFRDEPSEQWNGPNIYILGLSLFRLPAVDVSASG